MKDTFLYVFEYRKWIYKTKKKNAECYDYLFSATNEIFDEMIAKGF